VRAVWTITGLVSDVLLILGATFVGFLVDRNTDFDAPEWWYLAPSALLVIVVPLRIWYVAAAYRSWRYRFGPDALHLEHGVFWRASSSMPYHRLQQVDVAQGPVERWLGMATVQLRSAAATTDAVIPGIAADDVDRIRQLLLQRAGGDDGA